MAASLNKNYTELSRARGRRLPLWIWDPAASSEWHEQQLQLSAREKDINVTSCCFEYECREHNIKLIRGQGSGPLKLPIVLFHYSYSSTKRKSSPSI